jgi:hypothetical protein
LSGKDFTQCGTVIIDSFAYYHSTQWFIVKRWFKCNISWSQAEWKQVLPRKPKRSGFLRSRSELRFLRGHLTTGRWFHRRQSRRGVFVCVHRRGQVAARSGFFGLVDSRIHQEEFVRSVGAQRKCELGDWGAHIGVADVSWITLNSFNFFHFFFVPNELPDLIDHSKFDETVKLIYSQSKIGSIDSNIDELFAKSNSNFWKIHFLLIVLL